MTFNEIVTYFSLKGAVSDNNNNISIADGHSQIKIRLNSMYLAFVRYNVHGEVLSPFGLSIFVDDGIEFRPYVSCNINEIIPSILEMYIK